MYRGIFYIMIVCRWILPLGGRLNGGVVNLHQQTNWDVPATPHLILSLRNPRCSAHLHVFSQPTLGRKQRGSDRKSTAWFLIVSDCLVYFPRPCPPINPVICVRFGQSQRCVAMVRDCLHPIMPLAMWTHTHTHCSMPFCLCTTCFSGPPLLPLNLLLVAVKTVLVASSSVVELLAAAAAAALKRHVISIPCHSNYIVRCFKCVKKKNLYNWH